jgi:hypothetical protein
MCMSLLAGALADQSGWREETATAVV